MMMMFSPFGDLSKTRLVRMLSHAVVGFTLFVRISHVFFCGGRDLEIGIGGCMTQFMFFFSRSLGNPYYGDCNVLSAPELFQIKKCTLPYVS